MMPMGGAHVASVSAATNMCGNFGIAAVFWLLLKTEGNAFDQSRVLR